MHPPALTSDLSRTALLISKLLPTSQITCWAQKFLFPNEGFFKKCVAATQAVHSSGGRGEIKTLLHVYQLVGDEVGMRTDRREAHARSHEGVPAVCIYKPTQATVNRFTDDMAALAVPHAVLDYAGLLHYLLETAR